MLIQIESWELHMGPATGAVVVYCKKDMRGREITLLYTPPKGDHYVSPTLYRAQVVERDGVFAAIFPEIPGGTQHYLTATWGGKTRKSGYVSVTPGYVAEVDWR